jgi:hypothetical protein
MLIQMQVDKARIEKSEKTAGARQLLDLAFALYMRLLFAVYAVRICLSSWVFEFVSVFVVGC